MADPLLHALAEAFDDLDRPLQIRMRHAPHDAAQRLLDAFGALVVIDLSAPPCVERCNHKECRMSAAAVFEPNWISYRHSRVQVDKRRDADDETLEICPYCECEVDVTPAPHKPGCRGIGAPRASSATSVSSPIERKPPAAKPPVTPARHVEPEGLDLLEAMDAGERLPVEDDEEPELEEAAVCASGDVGAASSGTGSRRGAKTKWTRELALEAGVRWTREKGKLPVSGDARKGAGLPFRVTVYALFGKWSAYAAAITAELGDDAPTPRARATGSGRELEAKSGNGTAAAVPGTDGIASSTTTSRRRATSSSRPDTAGWIKVDGTGLMYRTSMEAFVAADEIEADGERVAAACREDGNHERADLAVDQARELADKIRTAARAADERGTADAASKRDPQATASDGGPDQVSASATVVSPPPAPTGRAASRSDLEPVDRPGREPVATVDLLVGATQLRDEAAYLRRRAELLDEAAAMIEQLGEAA